MPSEVFGTFIVTVPRRARLALLADEVALPRVSTFSSFILPWVTCRCSIPRGRSLVVKRAVDVRHGLTVVPERVSGGCDSRNAPSSLFSSSEGITKLVLTASEQPRQSLPQPTPTNGLDCATLQSTGLSGDPSGDPSGGPPPWLDGLAEGREQELPDELPAVPREAVDRLEQRCELVERLRSVAFEPPLLLLTLASPLSTLVRQVLRRPNSGVSKTVLRRRAVGVTASRKAAKRVGGVSSISE